MQNMIMGLVNIDCIQPQLSFSINMNGLYLMDIQMLSLMVLGTDGKVGELYYKMMIMILYGKVLENCLLVKMNLL